MARQKREVAPQETETQETAKEVYAQLAQDVAPVEEAVDPRIVELESQLAAANAALDARAVPVVPKRVLDPTDKRLDEPVIPRPPQSKIEKGEYNEVHTFRDLGVHPDDLDKKEKINPTTGQIVKSLFIKRTSGNLIEMP